MDEPSLILVAQHFWLWVVHIVGIQSKLMDWTAFFGMRGSMVVSKYMSFTELIFWETPQTVKCQVIVISYYKPYCELRYMPNLPIKMTGFKD